MLTPPNAVRMGVERVRVAVNCLLEDIRTGLRTKGTMERRTAEIPSWASEWDRESLKA
jgi:hypothetical protein